MKFSIFIEMQISEPTRADEAKLFHDCLQQATLADELGYHCVWAVEHHGLYEYSHSSAPEVFLAAVAARTRRIRVGHGVTLTPHRYNHPIRIAERIAALDILSHGRVNWGSGKSSSLVEQQAFETDPKMLHEQWAEALEIIPRMWESEVFTHRSRFLNIPATQVVPKPVQRPHPPMFAACSRPETAVVVGSMGLGALNFALGNDDYLAQKVRDYRAAVEQATPEGRQKNNHFAYTTTTLVLPDDRKACSFGMRGARFFAEALSQYYLSGTRPIGRLPAGRDFLSDDDLDAAMAHRSVAGSDLAMVIGDPVAARESVQRFVDTGVDELMLIMQMGTVPSDLVLQSLRVFAEEVMPHFA
jgi:alkanesulfonate monooxygenase SsuD/methylene tetrahydromethanopterin reductase-like flavin-dependent oxidoreductase (luciferase family)